MLRLVLFSLVAGCGNVTSKFKDRTKIREVESATGEFSEYAWRGGFCVCSASPGDNGGIDVRFSCTDRTSELVEEEVLYVSMPQYNTQTVTGVDIQIGASNWEQSGFGVGLARVEVGPGQELPDVIDTIGHPFFVHRLVAGPQTIQSADQNPEHFKDFEGGEITGFALWCDRVPYWEFDG